MSRKLEDVTKFRGWQRIQFHANLDEIKSKKLEMYTIKQIWFELYQEKKFTGSYEIFRRYFNKNFKDDATTAKHNSSLEDDTTKENKDEEKSNEPIWATTVPPRKPSSRYNHNGKKIDTSRLY